MYTAWDVVNLKFCPDGGTSEAKDYSSDHYGLLLEATDMLKGKMSDKLASDLPTGDVDVINAEALRGLQEDVDAAEKASQEKRIVKK